MPDIPENIGTISRLWGHWRAGPSPAIIYPQIAFMAELTVLAPSTSPKAPLAKDVRKVQAWLDEHR